MIGKTAYPKVLPLSYVIRLELRGGTCVSHSPALSYLQAVTLPLLARFGVRAHADVQAHG
jgi:RNA 3'-terminal phosphate cyclase